MTIPKDVSPSEQLQLREQVDRIVHSPFLSGSEALRNLLVFLTESYIARHGQPVKERDIALGVFGRSQDFDPQNDSVVRVHAGRLRSKLAEYYVSGGSGDPILIEIPRGAYALTYQLREKAHREVDSIPATIPMPPALANGIRSGAPVARWPVFVFMVVAAAGGAGYLAGSHETATVRKQPGAALKALWKDFFQDKEGPLVVFGNPVFIGSDFTGMRRMRDTDVSREALVDTFTGVGDLTGVFEITRLFSSEGRPPRVKRARTLAWDDAVGTNLVIVGSPLSIPALRDLPLLREFRFQDRTIGPGMEGAAIVNVHPLPGEETIYYGPQSRPYSFDYAVVARLPGIDPAHRSMILSGITTVGTEAAAEFVCSEGTAARLLEKVKAKQGGEPTWFEALIRVQVSGGVPMNPEILVTRVRK